MMNKKEEKEFFDWIKEHSMAGLRNILDFSGHHRVVDAWAIKVGDIEYINPTFEQLLDLWHNKKKQNEM